MKKANSNFNWNKIFQVKQNFSLIEVMVSIVVLAIAMTGLFSAITASRQLDELANEAELAMNAARQRIEMVKSTNFDNIIATFNNQAFAVSGLDPVAGQNTAGSVAVAQVGGDPNLLETIVTITWEGRSGRASRNLSARIGR